LKLQSQLALRLSGPTALANCTNRYPLRLKLVSCPTFRWTNPPFPLLNAVAPVRVH
jgi:hypothetical protein